jgi:hypothetical protein
MADARGRSEWARSSLLCTLIANVNRDPKSKPFTLDDFSPYKIEKAKPIKDTSAAFEALKSLVKKKAKK